MAIAANEEEDPALAAVVLLVDKDEPNTEDDGDFLLAVASSTAKPNPASSSSLLLSSLFTSRYLYLIGCFGTSCRTPAIGTSPCGGGCDVFLLVNVRFELSKKLSSSVSSESDAAAAARALLLIAPNGRDRRDHGEGGEAVAAAGFLWCFGMINKEKRGDNRRGKAS